MKHVRVFLFCFLFLAVIVTAGWAQQGKPVMTGAVLKITPTIQVSPLIRDAHIVSRVQLPPAEKLNLEKGTKMLVNQQFGAMINRSFAVTPKVQVLNKVGNRLQVEALVLFQDKTTYTATLTKLTYDVEGDQVFMKQKIDKYQIPLTATGTPGPVSANVVKMKKDILANMKAPIPEGYGPKGLANTPCNDISTAVSGTNRIHDIFVRAFGTAEKKIGNQSTKGAIMDVLQRGTRLLAWNNIGHGNPDLIVEWNGEAITYNDFNTSTPFQGVYGSVILLNSCDTCASPFNLKNAIMKHRPRTFVAGSKGLPIGSSEEVDVHFWDYTLIQNKNMGWALSEAEKKKNLQGYFCLIGYNGTFADVEAKKFTEDCVGFNPNNVQAKNVGGRWKVVDGNHWMIDFDKKEAEAKIAVQTIRHYGWNQMCFVGRPNAPMMYFKK